MVFLFWFSRRCRALAKGTAWAGLLRNSPSSSRSARRGCVLERVRAPSAVGPTAAHPPGASQHRCARSASKLRAQTRPRALRSRAHCGAPSRRVAAPLCAQRIGDARLIDDNGGGLDASCGAPRRLQRADAAPRSSQRWLQGARGQSCFFGRGRRQWCVAERRNERHVRDCEVARRIRHRVWAA